MTQERCPACGAGMARDTRAETIHYNGQTLTVQQPGTYCSSCEEVILTPEDIEATEAAIIDFRACVDGLLSAPEIMAIREVLKISQRKAGLILGGGPRAFQKYESRKATVSRPMSNLLRLLREHPEHLAVLTEEERNSGHAAAS